MKSTAVFGLLALALYCQATPIDRMVGEDDPDLFAHESGDCYDEEEAKSGVTNERLRWTNKTVIYSISSRFSDDQKQVILSGMKEIEDKTCLKFKERSSERNFVNVDNQRSGCFSSVGMRGGSQLLNLAQGCVSRGTVAHEFIHAIGFFHEQSRLDRDDFVTINTENIESGKEHNFNKERNTSTFNVTYDFESIMHYSRRAFSKNGKDTITPKREGVTRTGGRVVTEKDAQKLNNMYKC